MNTRMMFARAVAEAAMADVIRGGKPHGRKSTIKL